MDFDAMGDARVVLIRGLPGSGKSTLAREIAELGYVHLETDQFFETEMGYEYRADRLGDAQAWCMEAVRRVLGNGGRVVVSNVFTEVAHMADLLAMDQKAVVIRACGEFGSVHGVPSEVVESMRRRWQDFEGEVLLHG